MALRLGERILTKKSLRSIVRESLRHPIVAANQTRMGRGADTWRKLQISSSDARLPSGAGAVTPDSILASTFSRGSSMVGFLLFWNTWT